MAKQIYVGNLAFSVTGDEVRKAFEEHGEVQSVRLITDRDTGQPRGFGFVEMESEAADAAIKGLNGRDLGGRELNVNEARPRGDRGDRGGGGRQQRSW